MPGNINNFAGLNTVARSAVAELNEILQDWEVEHLPGNSNPTETLVKLCELFELHTNNFLKRDPDPFDDRHPVTSDPEGALGQLLRALFKRDTFVNKLVNHYLRDNFLQSQGVASDSTPLNTAACRLMLDLLHGLDIPQVFRDSDSTVSKLFTWAEKAPEPLRTYATGLLSAAVDIPEVATNFRDNNAHLLPIMLNRLWDLKDEGGGEEMSAGEAAVGMPSRPFAHLNSSRLSTDGAPAEDKAGAKAECPPAATGSPFKKVCFSPSNPQQGSSSSTKPFPNASSSPANPLLNVPFLSDAISPPPTPPISSGSAPPPPHGSSQATPNSLLNSSSLLNSDCSNSSWAEMSSYIVGSYQMYPVTRDTKVLFILKYLRPVGEYQESLGHVFEYKAIDLIFHYINVRKTCHARLSFEALRFLGSLLFHKKFCLEFVNRGGVQLLLQIPRPSLPADGVALCLWYLGYCEEAIERMCLLPDHILENLIRYALWLIESGHPSGSTHSIMFFGLVFRFRTVLDRFDRQDGLRKLVNVMSTMSLLQDLNDEDDSPEDPNETMMWQTVKHVCLTVKNYFEAHLAIRAHHSLYYHQRSQSLTGGNNSATPCYKPLNVSWESVNRNIESLLESMPLRARWEPVETFLKLKGVSVFLQIVSVALNDLYSTHRSEAAMSALDSLYICSVMPQVQMSFCEKITIPSDENIFHTSSPMEVPGFVVLVNCIHENNGQPLNTQELQRSSLNVLVNCLCAPLQRPGGPNFRALEYNSPSASSSSTRKTKTSSTASPASNSLATCEDIVKRSWDSVRTSNGIMHLLSLLHKKLPITDADCIRALACRALVGLSRSDAARQIMSKLPMFTQGQLQLLMREPILQEKRLDHVKFQRYGLELINAVSGKHNGKYPLQSSSSGGLSSGSYVGRSGNAAAASVSSDISLLSIHKADVVAQTRIGYNKQQLLQLIQMHLLKEGLGSAAATLQIEAGLPPLTLSSPMPPPRSLTATPALRNRLHLPNGTPRNIFSTHSPRARTTFLAATPTTVGSSSPTPAHLSSAAAAAALSASVAVTSVTPTNGANRNGSVINNAVIGSGLPTAAGTPTPLAIRATRGLKRSVEGRVLPIATDTGAQPTSTNSPAVTPSFGKSENGSSSNSGAGGSNSIGTVSAIENILMGGNAGGASPVVGKLSVAGGALSTPGCSTNCAVAISPAFTAAGSAGNLLHGAAIDTNVTNCGISLDGIVREYLTNQHALCQNPVVTCPTFDLFHPHRCPEPRTNRLSGSYNNITHRLTHRSYYAPRMLLTSAPSGGTMRGTTNGGGGGGLAQTLPSLDRRFAYSRYRASDVIRPPPDGSGFATVCFTNDDKGVLVGTTGGQIICYNINDPSDEYVISAHQGCVTNLVMHKTGSTLLSSCHANNEAMLWNCEEAYSNSEPTFMISNCQYAIFNAAQDKILSTMDSATTLHDISTRAAVCSFQPKLSNQYQNNRADINTQDDLVLTDGVLFDVRSGREIHKFDKINPLINGSFHRNGLEVISSSEVWDLRTYHLLRTIPSLNMCNVLFNHHEDVLFGTTVPNDAEGGNFDTSFKVVDAVNYSSIATVDTRRNVSSLDISNNDCQLAIVETAGCQDELYDAVLRLYDIAMTRQEEDEDPMSDDDLNSDDDDDDDSDDTDDEDQPQDGPGSDGGFAILFTDEEDDEDDDQNIHSDDDDNSQNEDDAIILEDDEDQESEDDDSDVEGSDEDNNESDDDDDEAGDEHFHSILMEIANNSNFTGLTRRTANGSGGAAAGRSRRTAASTSAGSRSSGAVTAAGGSNTAAGEGGSGESSGVTWSRKDLMEAMSRGGGGGMWSGRPIGSGSVAPVKETPAIKSAPAEPVEPMDETEDDQWEDISEEGRADVEQEQEEDEEVEEEEEL